MINTTDIVLLMEEASKRLETHDPIFTDKTETVLAILRSKGVISSKRLQQIGKYHTILAASLVLAHEKDSDLYLTTRSQGELFGRGVSTTLVKFLDAAIEQGLILSQGDDFKARGRLSLDQIITSYLEYEVA
jgi:hypothetical protein